MVASKLAAVSAALVVLGWGAVAVAEAGKPAWSYSGETGPARWSALASEFAVCGAGAEQSPIDLGAADAPGSQPRVVIDYKPLPLTILHNGHTVEVVVANGSRILLDGKPYDLLQFHFHTPSEHEVDGKAYPAEVHFVHRSAEGGLAVIGAFIDGTAANRALADIVAYAPTSATAPRTYTWVTIDPARIMPQPTAFWSYGGSLTTPPCSEGVRWMVQKAPLALSREHIAALAKAMGPNARPVQPVGARQVAAPR